MTVGALSQHKAVSSCRALVYCSNTSNASAKPSASQSELVVLALPLTWCLRLRCSSGKNYTCQRIGGNSLVLLYYVPPAAFFDASNLPRMSGCAEKSWARGVISAASVLNVVLKSSGTPLSGLLSLSLWVKIFFLQRFVNRREESILPGHHEYWMPNARDTP